MKTATLCCALVAAAGWACAAPGVRRTSPLEGHRLAAGVLSEALRIRASGCESKTGDAAPLTRRRRLDAAARELASGFDIEGAVRAAGYRAMRSASLELSGDFTSQSLARLLARRFCRQLTNPALTDIGVYGRGRKVWLMVAQPLSMRALADASRVARDVLQRVNAARARGRRCGSRWYGRANPLEPSRRLRNAALAHSRDMALHGRFSHVGSGGSTPGERITRAGLAWSAVGENIAEGQTSAAAVVRAWLASPEHCANIMDPDFTETAVAFTIAPGPTGRVFWTEDFARRLTLRRQRKR